MAAGLTKRSDKLKFPVIASQCAHWRGNPFSKTFRFYPSFQKNRSFWEYGFPLF